MEAKMKMDARDLDFYYGDFKALHGALWMIQGGPTPWSFDPHTIPNHVNRAKGHARLRHVPRGRDLFQETPPLWIFCPQAAGIA